MTTYSQLVDDIVKELVRPDMKVAVASYTNQTIRELHFKPNQNSPIQYDANREEDVLAIDTDTSWSWPLPSATRLQSIESVYLDDLGIYVPERNPRIALRPSYEPFAEVYRYRSGPVLVLSGVSAGWTGKVSYFMFVRSLGYLPVANRVIVYNAATDTYVLVAGGTPTQEQLDTETNWMLQRWPETVKEGVRAKVWKRIGDVDRSRLAYSSFESSRESVWNSEPSS